MGSDEPKVPLHTWSAPTKSKQRVHMDFGKLEGQMLLILVDSFSKWLEVWLMLSTTSERVIEKLRRVISVFGLPECLVADNGPPFGAEELKIL
jgi:hypothetical protein